MVGPRYHCSVMAQGSPCLSTLAVPLLETGQANAQNCVVGQVNDGRNIVLVLRGEPEKDRSDTLLLNIISADIAEELKAKGRADARDFDRVSILFTDFKGFTEHELVEHGPGLSCAPRGKVSAKGSGELEMYCVERRSDLATGSPSSIDH